jgi:hypothetical protein
MGRVIIANILRFVVLICLQVFLLKNIGYYYLTSPFLYNPVHFTPALQNTQWLAVSACFPDRANR